jgi:hypothetical protein
VKSQLSQQFLDCFARLPESVKAQARKSYRLWKSDPTHPSLHFKRIHTDEMIYSCRVNKGWRTLGLVKQDTITWFWIGSHADYDAILKQL